MVHSTLGGRKDGRTEGRKAEIDVPLLSFEKAGDNKFHLYSTKHAHKCIISDNRLHTSMCSRCLHTINFRLGIQKVCIL